MYVKSDLFTSNVLWKICWCAWTEQNLCSNAIGFLLCTMQFLRFLPCYFWFCWNWAQRSTSKCCLWRSLSNLIHVFLTWLSCLKAPLCCRSVHMTFLSVKPTCGHHKMPALQNYQTRESCGSLGFLKETCFRSRVLLHKQSFYSFDDVIKVTLLYLFEGQNCSCHLLSSNLPFKTQLPVVSVHV